MRDKIEGEGVWVRPPSLRRNQVLCATFNTFQHCVHGCCSYFTSFWGGCAARGGLKTEFPLSHHHFSGQGSLRRHTNDIYSSGNSAPPISFSPAPSKRNETPSREGNVARSELDRPRHEEYHEKPTAQDAPLFPPAHQPPRPLGLGWNGQGPPALAGLRRKWQQNKHI